MPELPSGLLPGLTVAITGATGNVGTALLRALADGGAARVRGLARRRPPDIAPYDGVDWYLTDLGEPDSEEVLAEFLHDADVVVHLAWALQPGREPELLHRVNVEGTGRVLDAAGAAGVPHVVHMSSLGVYSAGPPARRSSLATRASATSSAWTTCTRSDGRGSGSSLATGAGSSRAAPNTSGPRK